MNARRLGVVVALGLVAAACDRGKSGDKPGATATAPADKPAATTPATATASAWVEIDPKGDVEKAVAEQAAGALAAGKRPFLYLHADWCAPCKAIQETRTDPLMVKAFTGTHIIGLDIDHVPAAALTALGASVDSIPTFFAAGSDGRSTGRSISGGAWEEDIPANMAPPLAAFFAGS
jgi:thiol:disulfide interchange protein